MSSAAPSPSKRAWACKDTDGKTIGEELARIGYAGDIACGGREVGAFFEAHIEQGPILEADDKTIGVVQGVQGIRWFDVTVTGMESHAGTTPMERRKDALVGAVRLISEINRIAMDNAPDARATIGMMAVSPNSRNVIPGSVFFSVDLRHPDPELLAAMTDRGRDLAGSIAADGKLEIAFEEIWYSPGQIRRQVRRRRTARGRLARLREPADHGRERATTRSMCPGSHRPA